MKIEESIKKVEEVKKEYATMDGLKDYVIAIETLLTAYEKEKEKNKEAIEFIENWQAHRVTSWNLGDLQLILDILEEE